MDYWTRGVTSLGKIVSQFPQTAYAVLVRSLQNKWNYLQRVTSGSGDLYKPIEKAIREKLLPALLDQPSIGDNLCSHIALSVKQAGLVILDPTASTGDNHAASMYCYAVLMESLLTGAPLDIHAH